MAYADYIGRELPVEEEKSEESGQKAPEE